MKWICFLGIAFSVHLVRAQVLIQNNAGVYVQKGGVMVIQGNLDNYSDILGEGNIMMADSTQQYLNSHGFTINYLTVNNQKNVALKSDLRINNLLDLQKGNLQLQNSQLTLGYDANILAAEKLFIHAEGTGKVRKIITQDLSGYRIPLGSENSYAPVTLSTKGNYTNAHIDIGAQAAVHPHKPPNAEQYIPVYWTIDKSGIAGNVQTIAQYPPPTKGGPVNDLEGFFWDGLRWTPTSLQINRLEKLIATAMVADHIELYAMRPLTEGRVLLFPNPVHTAAVLHIPSKVEQRAEIKIIDARGRIVETKSIYLFRGVNRTALLLKGLGNGNYSVQVITPADSHNIQFIKL